MALEKLASRAPCVVITLGERGLLWRRGSEDGQLPAFAIAATDTTGAGDAFHGAYAAALAAGLEWLELLRTSSAVGALCCTGLGARPSLPTASELAGFLARADLKTETG
jgi:sulfofructose kinase